MSENARVLILFGSESDRAVMQEASTVLENLGVPCRLETASAHRSPDRVRDSATAVFPNLWSAHIVFFTL